MRSHSGTGAPRDSRAPVLRTLSPSLFPGRTSAAPGHWGRVLGGLEGVLGRVLTVFERDEHDHEMQFIHSRGIR